MKLLIRILIIFILYTTDRYLIYKSHQLEELNHQYRELISMISKRVSLLESYKKHINVIKNRVSFISDVNEDKVEEFLKKTTEMSGAKVKNVTHKNNEWGVVISGNDEHHVTSALLTILRSAPVLLKVSKFEVSGVSDNTKCKIEFTFDKYHTKNGMKYIASPYSGFGIIDNTLTPLCIIKNDNESYVLIDYNWLRVGDYYRNLRVNEISSDYVILYSDLLHAEFKLRIGEKTKICPQNK